MQRFPYNSNGDEQQYPNGFDGLFWKTTGPGYYNTRNRHKTTHDIEIVNGRNLRTDSETKPSRSDSRFHKKICMVIIPMATSSQN